MDLNLTSGATVTSTNVGARTLARKAFSPAAKATPAVAVKLAPEGIVVAIVAVTGCVDMVNDLIVPGAFANSLKRRRPKVVDDHEWKNRRGRTLHAEEWMPGDPRLPKTTKDGKPWPPEAGALVATMQYNLDTIEGAEAWKWVKFYAESNEAEFSIGYNVPDGQARKRADGVRIILMVELFEFSHVLFGAHPLTMALEVKSMHGGSAGTQTHAALEPTQKVGGPIEDDEESSTPPMPDAPWDDTENTAKQKRAPMEAKSAAAVVLAATAPAVEVKSVEDAALPPAIEHKQFSMMKGSYEERNEAITRAVRDLFSAMWTCDADRVWAYPVATYPTEVIMSVSSCDHENANYLIGYSLNEATLDVALEQPEKVTLSLIAEPVDGHPAAGIDGIEADAAIEAAVLSPIVAAIGSVAGLEKKSAEVIHELMRAALGIETKDAEYEVEARNDGAEPHGDVYDAENLPEGEWGEYHKPAGVKCTPMVGKWSAKTQEGLVNAEDGWLALDKGGHPYPISDDEFDASYVPLPDAGPDAEADVATDGPEGAKSAEEAPADEPPADEGVEGESVTEPVETPEGIDPATGADEPEVIHQEPAPDEDPAEFEDAPSDAEEDPEAVDELVHEAAGAKTAPKGEFEGKNELVTLDPDEHFSMRDDLASGLDGQLEDRNKNN